MKMPLVLWGLVVLAGFAATHWAVGAGAVQEAYAWIGWAVILNILNWYVGKGMKGDAGTAMAWKVFGAFGFLTTLVIALTGWAPLWWLMSLWLLLMGAMMYSSTHEKTDATMMAGSLVYMFSALFVSGFGANYWLVGGVILGLPAILHGLVWK